ncbi:serine/threonine-protein kinase unc-51-like [Daphnia carinata]|uniref:serine/threonine-protein kinase unc-51-like n=1 Tax=Daphnia carinata TaxID=120202 RepID=UPI002868A05E|nr:serine/threonine-protein kinase unc-51-like [Daphnia carinata]
MAFSTAAQCDFPKPWSGNIKYNKDSVLGKGGFGVVYRGTYNDETVAVKRIVLENVDPLNREVALQTQLDHENVLKILTVEQSSDFRYIVLELCNGTLEQLCDDTYVGAELPSDAKILRQMTEGLRYIHTQKLVHRDIKPENVLFYGTTTPVLVKLSDFGLSKHLSTNETCSMSGFKGSQLWMPPELLQLTDNSLQMGTMFQAKGSPSSDIFATGCVTFYYVTRGIHPFGAGAIDVPSNIRHDRPVNIERGDPGLNYLLDIAREMIRFNPKERLGLDKVLEKLQFRQRLSSTRTPVFHVRSKLCNQSMPDNRVTTCVFHPVDPVLAVGFHDGSVVLITNEIDETPFLSWDRETLSAVHDHLSTSFALINMEWNVNGTLLAASTDKGSVILWTYQNKEINFDSVQLGDNVGNIYWSPFATHMFVANFRHETRRRARRDSGHKGGLLVWNGAIDEEETVETKLRTTYHIRDVAWISHDEVALACDGKIRIFTIMNGTSLSANPKQLLHIGEVGVVAWNERSKMLASGSSEGTLKAISIQLLLLIYAEKIK